jgi:rubrerythrin
MTTVSCSSVDTVINFAIEKEEKAMDFYQKCADRAKNQGIKKFFQEMAAEEKRHCDLLKDLNPNALGDIKLEKGRISLVAPAGGTSATRTESSRANSRP